MCALLEIMAGRQIIQHLLGEIALSAVSAGVGVAALDVAVLAAVDVVVRARRDIVGAAERVVIGAGVDHGRLAAFKAASEERSGKEKLQKQCSRGGSHMPVPVGLFFVRAGLDPAIHRNQGKLRRDWRPNNWSLRRH